jgi:hypothetical protein
MIQNARRVGDTSVREQDWTAKVSQLRNSIKQQYLTSKINELYEGVKANKYITRVQKESINEQTKAHQQIWTSHSPPSLPAVGMLFKAILTRRFPTSDPNECRSVKDDPSCSNTDIGCDDDEAV